MSRFRGTAPYYARYRPGYPAALFDLVQARYGLGLESRVLDIATGTGQLALPLAQLVGEVVAIDVDDGMLDELRRVAPANVRVECRAAEELGADLGRFSVATIGRAFHWLDRDLVLRNLHAISGGVVIAGDAMTPGEPWETLQAVAAEFVGDRRPTHTGETWVEIVARSPYGHADEIAIEVDRTWTQDDVVGFAFSLSWASPALLGDRAAAFERTLRERLGPGPWTERASFEVILGGVGGE